VATPAAGHRAGPAGAGRGTRRRHLRRALGCGLAALALAAGTAGTARAGQHDLLELSLEDLMHVEVTSASPQAHALEDTAAAVYVLTAEDIRRSGARTLPELLRRVPGLQVAEINDHTWAVSARGFNDRFANLLLVLVDGRPVYNPLYGGVHWDAEAPPLWNVERIEVIRGPGGSLWGANAVNGVVNVITRDAASVQGAYVAGGAGRDERAYAAARQGVYLEDRGDLTLYVQAFDRRVRDWNESRGGFRWDRLLAGGHLSVDGEAYDGGAGREAYVASLSPPELARADDRERFGGGHLMATLWRGDDRDGWWLRAYATRDGREDILHRSRIRTESLELRHARRLGRHGVTVGGGLREVVDVFDGSLTTGFDPRRERALWYHALIQDDMDLTDAVRLSVGTKLERTPYGGWENQPSARALWRVAPHHTAWAAVSRAVRVPTRAYRDATLVQAVLPGTPPTLVTVTGDPDPRTTTMTALEAGYRARPAEGLTFDAAAFLNRYDDVTTLEPGTPYLATDPAPDHLVAPLVLESLAHATARGAEAVLAWQATDRVRLTATYAWLRLGARPDAASADLDNVKRHDGASPSQQVGLALHADPAPAVELDGALRAVDGLPALGVPGYADLSARVAWKPVAGLTVSVAGEHLLRTRHREFGIPGVSDVVAAPVPRTVFARLTWTP